MDFSKGWAVVAGGSTWEAWMEHSWGWGAVGCSHMDGGSPEAPPALRIPGHKLGVK